jgi:hypothetical protein
MTVSSSPPPLQLRIADQDQRCRAASLRAADIRQRSDAACLILKLIREQLRLLRLVNAHYANSLAFSPLDEEMISVPPWNGPNVPNNELGDFIRT